MASSLADFILIGPQTFLYTPPKPTRQLIILCTWLGAAPKHIAKYTVLYRSIAPNARILLIESTFSNLTSAFECQQQVVKFAPAVAAVLDTLAVVECKQYSQPHPAESEMRHVDDRKTIPRLRQTTYLSSQVQPKILLHIFSNGGMNSATRFWVFYAHAKTSLWRSQAFCLTAAQVRARRIVSCFSGFSFSFTMILKPETFSVPQNMSSKLWNNSC